MTALWCPSAIHSSSTFFVRGNYGFGYVSKGNPLEEIDLFVKAATRPGALKKVVEEAEEDVGVKVSCVMGDAFLSYILCDLGKEIEVPWVPCWNSGEHSFYVHVYTDVIRQRNLKMDESGIAKVVPSTIDLNMEYQGEDSEYDSSDMDFDINSEPDFICDEVNENIDVLRDDDDTNGTNESHPMLEKLAPPNVRMIFASYEDVIEYYHEFGKQNGFQMKIRSRENVKGTECGNKYDCTRLRLVCKKEGKFVPRGKDPSKPTRSEFTGCKAKITATFDKSSGEWKLTTVVLEHNHPINPSNSKFMRNYRFISPHNKDVILTNEKAGVPIGRNFATFAVRYGGFGAVPFSEKDCRNLVSKHRRLCLKEGDFSAMEKHFMDMSTKDKKIFYKYDTSDGTLKNVFWADGRCRAAYRDFGDVVSFDPTYLRNRYRMPFCPFIGVNHHGQSILLGCALISGEDTKNYIWLFKTWLACMSGKAPNGIVTDQCMAIGSAIREVFPNTKHRWCIWHIMRNAKKHLNFHEDRDIIRRELRRTLHDSLHVEEFEKKWKDVIEKHKLQQINWFNEMFNLRHRWVPIYFKNDFWVGMSSTQRSESMNFFFKAFVNLNTTLKEFVEQYCLALGKRANEEENETFRSMNKPTLCFTEFVSESVFQRLYTSKKFEEFQEQVRMVTYTSATKSHDNGSVCVYDVVTKKAKWQQLMINHTLFFWRIWLN
ncbi:protein FAR1-RELATED SEQUENCE 5-like [Chenopodium quinoa]|uniref:protein FAR1-RELATED SEQUENCE 5-like n=1 Tax=Chenopodium quinoa TaxID=63459 RepID=UPI000B784727|nr:protein FAR1-RELATED SEQUENCE 5-like [Chenopodium quinoa]